MAALHTLLRLYKPDNELAALGRPKENYCTTTQCPAWQASKHCPGASNHSWPRRGRRRSTARAPQRCQRLRSRSSISCSGTKCASEETVSGSRCHHWRNESLSSDSSFVRLSTPANRAPCSAHAASRADTRSVNCAVTSVTRSAVPWASLCSTRPTHLVSRTSTRPSNCAVTRSRAASRSVNCAVTRSSCASKLRKRSSIAGSFSAGAGLPVADLGGCSGVEALTFGGRSPHLCHCAAHQRASLSPCLVAQQYCGSCGISGG